MSRQKANFELKAETAIKPILVVCIGPSADNTVLNAGTTSDRTKARKKFNKSHYFNFILKTGNQDTTVSGKKSPSFDKRVNNTDHEIQFLNKEEPGLWRAQKQHKTTIYFSKLKNLYLIFNIRDVANTGILNKRQIRTEAGTPYTHSVTSCHTKNGDIQGLIIVLIDIINTKRDDRVAVVVYHHAKLTQQPFIQSAVGQMPFLEEHDGSVKCVLFTYFTNIRVPSNHVLYPTDLHSRIPAGLVQHALAKALLLPAHLAAE